MASQNTRSEAYAWKESVLTDAKDTISAMGDVDRQALGRRLDVLSHMRHLPSTDETLQEQIDMVATDLVFKEENSVSDYDALTDIVQSRADPYAWKTYKLIKALDSRPDITQANWNILEMRLDSLSSFRAAAASQAQTIAAIERIADGLIQDDPQARSAFDSLSMRFSGAWRNSTQR